MTAGTHRAVVRHLAAPGGRSRLAVQRRRTPVLASGEVLLAPLVAGVCGTDRQILAGSRDDPAPVLGHEGAAVVLDSRAGPGGPRVGSTVVVSPTHPTDPFLLGHTTEGFWAERVRIPAPAVSGGLVLPLGDLDPGLSPLAEPLSSVIAGADIAAGPADRATTLVVVGDGTVGELVLTYWRRRRVFDRVVVVGRRPPAGPAEAAGVLRTCWSDPALAAVLGSIEGTALAVLCTPRSGTRAAAERLIRDITCSLVLDLHGGIDAEPVDVDGRRIDLAALRAANRAGLPFLPVIRASRRPGGGVLHLFGHRGAAPDQLRRALIELGSDVAAYAPILTHRTTLDALPALVNGLFDSDRWERGGVRVRKIAVDVQPSAGLT